MSRNLRPIKAEVSVRAEAPDFNKLPSQLQLVDLAFSFSDFQNVDFGLPHAPSAFI